MDTTNGFSTSSSFRLMLFFLASYFWINPCFTAGKRIGVRNCHAIRGPWKTVIFISIVYVVNKVISILDVRHFSVTQTLEAMRSGKKKKKKQDQSTYDDAWVLQPEASFVVRVRIASSTFTDAALQGLPLVFCPTWQQWTLPGLPPQQCEIQCQELPLSWITW
jgi:hypothetical protein